MLPVQEIHPVLVHFPIVLMYTLLVLDLVALSGHRDVTVRSDTGTISTFIALSAGLLAIVAWYFGGLALDIAESGGFHSDVAEIHEGLGGTTAFAFLAWGIIRLGLWLRNRGLGRFALLVPLIELVGAGLVTVTAYYGGQLVYDLGVNVARGAAGG